MVNFKDLKDRWSKKGLYEANQLCSFRIFTTLFMLVIVAGTIFLNTANSFNDDLNQELESVLQLLTETSTTNTMIDSFELSKFEIGLWGLLFIVILKVIKDVLYYKYRLIKPRLNRSIDNVYYEKGLNFLMGIVVLPVLAAIYGLTVITLVGPLFFEKFDFEVFFQFFELSIVFTIILGVFIFLGSFGLFTQGLRLRRIYKDIIVALSIVYTIYLFWVYFVTQNYYWAIQLHFIPYMFVIVVIAERYILESVNLTKKRT